MASRLGLTAARAIHKTYQVKCLLCMRIRRRMRQLQKLTFNQQIHYRANTNHFERVDKLEFLECHAFDYRDEGELAEVTRSRVIYNGFLSGEAAESLAEVLAKDVATVNCLSRAPEVLRIGVLRIGNRSAEAADKLKRDLLEYMLDMLFEDFSWIRRRDQAEPRYEEDWDEDEDEDEPAVLAAREEAFLSDLNLSLDQMIFFLREAYEIGNEEWCGELPVVWLQPADSECCTFVTGCDAALARRSCSVSESGAGPIEEFLLE